MIDIENEIFTECANRLRERFGETFEVYGVTLLAPPTLPCACIEETDNYPYLATRDSDSNENHVELVYDVNVYSNKANRKKAESKEILSVIDDYFINIGFTRTTRQPIPLDDATKYRLFARYTAIASKDSTIYRR